MKRILALLLCVLGFLAAPVRADVELSFDWYYDQLSPMGEWVEVDGYGYVWHPNGVDEDWAPYNDGYWTYTDAGWTWVSYEDWGSICYHYGRWVHLADYGWCWVPGYEWGPAWVSWRQNDDYIGWAPLPPECDWDADRGVSVWVDVHYDIGPRWYSFCRVRDFGAPVIRHVVLPRIRNVDFCFSTRNITNISYNRDYGCVFNGGFDYDYIRARCERPVPALKLVRNTTNIYINNNIIVNAPRGNALVVATPRVAVNAKKFTRVPAVKRTFKRDAVTRGWAGLEKPETRDRLLGKMREESKGLTPVNAPARPVKKEALAALPKEVKLDAPTPGMKRLPAERPNRGGLSREDVNERNEQPGQAGRPERMRPNGRGETAGAPATGEAARPNGRPATAEADDARKGGLRRGPDRKGEATTETPAPAREQQPGRVAEQDKPAGADRAAGMRDARENARRQAQENATLGNTERGNAARENLERESKEREQANAARAGAERAQRQREANENAASAAEMNRRAQENANRAAQENAARENAARENAARQNAASENTARARAAEAAAARRAQMEAQNDRAEQQRRSAEQAEAGQRQAAQRAAIENARREAAERQTENARRQMAERQNDDARRQAVQRQAEVQQQRQAAQQRQAEMQRERAAAQQNEVRQRAAEAAQQRAMESQRQQAAESARARAMENQQRAAAASQARAEAQQRAAAEAANRRQAEPRSQEKQENGDARRRR